MRTHQEPASIRMFCGILWIRPKRSQAYTIASEPCLGALGGCDRCTRWLDSGKHQRLGGVLSKFSGVGFVFVVVPPRRPAGDNRTAGGTRLFGTSAAILIITEVISSDVKLIQTTYVVQDHLRQHWRTPHTCTVLRVPNPWKHCASESRCWQHLSGRCVVLSEP